MSAADPIILIKNLRKSFFIAIKGLSIWEKLIDLFSHRNKMEVKALDGFDLTVYRGQYIGIIGKNGSGKSTLLKIILGCIDPDRGSVVDVRGSVVRLSLNDGFDINLSARDNIYLNGTILGLSLEEIGVKMKQIIAFAEIEKFVDSPLKYFSSGMRSRLAFSVAIHAEADIYLVDEFFADVGDEAFKEKSQKVFEQKIKSGKTVLHVSHSMELLKGQCDKIVLLKNGKAEVFTHLGEALDSYRKND